MVISSYPTEPIGEVGDVLNPQAEFHHGVRLHLILWARQLQFVILHGKPVFDDVSQGLNVEISLQWWTQKEQRPAVDVVRWVEEVVANAISKMLRI